MQGVYALGGVVGGAVLLLVCFCVGCLCLRHCCCKDNTRKRLEMNSFKATLREEEEHLISKHPKTDQRREELRKKYGNAISGGSSASLNGDAFSS